jgi:hypothetical protein
MLIDLTTDTGDLTKTIKDLEKLQKFMKFGQTKFDYHGLTEAVKDAVKEAVGKRGGAGKVGAIEDLIEQFGKDVQTWLTEMKTMFGPGHTHMRSQFQAAVQRSGMNIGEIYQQYISDPKLKDVAKVVAGKKDMTEAQALESMKAGMLVSIITSYGRGHFTKEMKKAAEFMKGDPSSWGSSEALGMRLVEILSGQTENRMKAGLSTWLQKKTGKKPVREAPMQEINASDPTVLAAMKRIATTAPEVAKAMGFLDEQGNIKTSGSMLAIRSTNVGLNWGKMENWGEGIPGYATNEQVQQAFKLGQQKYGNAAALTADVRAAAPAISSAGRQWFDMMLKQGQAAAMLSQLKVTPVPGVKPEELQERLEKLVKKPGNPLEFKVGKIELEQAKHQLGTREGNDVTMIGEEADPAAAGYVYRKGGIMATFVPSERRRKALDAQALAKVVSSVAPELLTKIALGDVESLKKFKEILDQLTGVVGRLEFIERRPEYEGEEDVQGSNDEGEEEVEK